MKSRLAEELKEFGCDSDAETFRSAIVDEMFRRYGCWNVDELLCNPKEAMEFCSSIRKRFVDSIPDHLILKTMINYRKSRSLPFGKHGKKVNTLVDGSRLPDAYFPLVGSAEQ